MTTGFEYLGEKLLHQRLALFVRADDHLVTRFDAHRVAGDELSQFLIAVIHKMFPP